MKSIFYRILLYPIALFGVIFLFNIDISSNTLENQQLIKSTPFFAEFKVYYSLSFVIIIIGLLEKLNSKKIDNNLLLKVLIFLTSLFFCYQGYKIQPGMFYSTPYTWFDYFRIIFSGSIWIGLYVQMLMKNEKNKN